MESNNLQPFTLNGVNYVVDFDMWRAEQAFREARELEMASLIPRYEVYVRSQPQNPVHLIMGDSISAGVIPQINYAFPHPDWKPKDISQLATIKHGKA